MSAIFKNTFQTKHNFDYDTNETSLYCDEVEIIRDGIHGIEIKIKITSPEYNWDEDEKKGKFNTEAAPSAYSVFLDESQTKMIAAILKDISKDT